MKDLADSENSSSASTDMARALLVSKRALRTLEAAVYSSGGSRGAYHGESLVVVENLEAYLQTILCV